MCHNARSPTHTQNDQMGRTPNRPYRVTGGKRKYQKMRTFGSFLGFVGFKTWKPTFVQYWVFRFLGFETCACYAKLENLKS